MAGFTKSGRRRKPMRSLGLGVLAALALAVVLLQTAPGIRDWFSPVRATVDDGLARTTGGGWFGWLTGLNAREREIRELELKIAELERYATAHRALVERVRAYEDLLDLASDVDRPGVTARVVGESDGPFKRTLLADAGAGRGVEPGAAAVNEGGLVGRVLHVGQVSARILTVKDVNSRVPVMGEISGVRAILHGGNDSYGVLRDFPQEDVFRAGERVMTTGEAGLFPRGLVAGYAIIAADGDQADQRVRFAMDEARGGYVRLLEVPRVPTPEDVPAIEPAGTLAEAAASGDD